MKNRLILSLTLCALTVLLCFGASPIQAQATGTTDVDIDFPPLLILYYYSSIDVTLPASAVDQMLAGGGTITAGATSNGVDHFQSDQGVSALTATENAGELDVTFVSPAGATTLASAINMNLLNVWAVRALAGGTGGTPTDYQIKVERNGSADVDLVNGTSTITITDIGLKETSQALYTGEGVDLQLTVPGLATPDVGDVQLELDLTGVDTAGLHSSVASNDFTITAEHL